MNNGLIRADFNKVDALAARLQGAGFSRADRCDGLAWFYGLW